MDIQDTVIESEEFSVVNRLTEMLDLKNVLRTYKTDLRALKESHEDYDELEELKKRVKELEDKIKTSDDYRRIKESIEDTAERYKLVEEIVIANLHEQQLTMFDMGDKYARIVNNKKIKFTKE